MKGIENIIELIGLITLFYYGTFIKTRFFNYAKGMFAFVILGALFKLLHYSFANVLIAIGWLGILIIYGFSFINKPVKRLLDFLKLIWVFIVIPKTLMRFFHYPYVEYLDTISLITMSFALMLFFRERMKANNRL